MPTIEIEPDQLLQAALQMPREELKQFVTRLFALKARQEAPGLAEREAELLTKINEGLPGDMQQRLNELIKKRQAETISPEELQELIQLTDQVEMFDAQRLEFLLELSWLRNISLNEVIKQLGLKPIPQD